MAGGSAEPRHTGRYGNETGHTRRWFLKMTAAGALGLYVSNAFGGAELADAAAIPGGSLIPRQIPKFVQPLAIPGVMPTTGRANRYELSVRQFRQQMLPPGLPTTTVWSYVPTSQPTLRTTPAYTIEAVRGTPTTITWVNGLVDGSGRYRPHLFPVDQTLHWANPGGGTSGRDCRPMFMTTPGPYTGPVPVVTHVHGLADSPDWSDGYAEAWFLPRAVDIPAGFASVGSWYDFFRAKSGRAWAKGTATYVYPNGDRPSTAWYHDHTVGMTRLNVYAGTAGFYLVRSNDPADNPTVAGSGAPAVLPSGPYEIPLVVQDRAFNTDGSLFYPSSRAFFDGFAGPYVPDTDVAPIWNPEFFGNCMVVNGRTWPYLDVQGRRYRFRILNACSSRTLRLGLRRADGTTVPGLEVWQIGSDGGFLPAAAPVTELVLGPAERADVVIDFTAVAAGTAVTLVNRGPDAPYTGGGAKAADAQTTGQVMQFRVGLPVAGTDTTTRPASLVMPALPASRPVTRTRTVAMLERMSMSPGVPAIPVEASLGQFDPNVGLPNGVLFQAWSDPVTENPAVGDTEVWELYNFTEDAHPIHLHGVSFEVVNRQKLDGKTGRPAAQSKPTPPAPGESGLKDTVLAFPGEVTRLRGTFRKAGQYTWHCHIIEHEDNEMMRPFRVGPPQAGEPVPNHHGGM